MSVFKQREANSLTQLTETSTVFEGRGLSPSAGTGQSEQENIWPLGADCQLPHTPLLPRLSALCYPCPLQQCTVHFRLPGARGSNHRRRLSPSPARVLTFLARSFSPPASVPLNCRGWLLCSKGPSYRSAPLTLQGSDCSDGGTPDRAHGSICLPLEHRKI